MQYTFFNKAIFFFISSLAKSSKFWTLTAVSSILLDAVQLDFASSPDNIEASSFKADRSDIVANLLSSSWCIFLSTPNLCSKAPICFYHYEFITAKSYPICWAISLALFFCACVSHLKDIVNSQTKKIDLVRKSDLGHFYLLCEHSLSFHVAVWTWWSHVTTSTVVGF